MISDDDWLIRKQTQLLQDIVEAKAIAVELLENLTVLADMLVKNAKRTGTQVPNREAFCHLIERVHVLLDASHETTNKLLKGASDDEPLDNAIECSARANDDTVPKM